MLAPAARNALEDACSHALRRYVVKDVLGSGTFGQVVRCTCETGGETVAVKVIKNLPAYYQQVLVRAGTRRALQAARGQPGQMPHRLPLVRRLGSRWGSCSC